MMRAARFLVFLVPLCWDSEAWGANYGAEENAELEGVDFVLWITVAGLGMEVLKSSAWAPFFPVSRR